MQLHVFRQRILSLAVFVFVAAFAASPAHAGVFLDIDTLTTGVNGAFTGTLDGIAVTGSISTTDAFFEFSPTGTGYFDSTTDNTSPQYSYAGIYTPAVGATDRVGYALFGGNGVRTATITVNFDSAVTNPVFHVANLDSLTYDFASTSGLLGLTLLSGNGGADNDGLLVSGTVISDANQNTIIAGLPTDPPLTTGDRSAYGSILLNGTFNSLVIEVTNPLGVEGDGGSFTLSTVPEPSSLAMAGIGLLSLGFAAFRRRAG